MGYGQTVATNANTPPRWLAVGRLAGRAPTSDDVRVHRLEPFAARLYRDRGLPVPDEIAAEERFAAVALLAAPTLLARIRAAYDGRIMVMKGPEIAALYPDPALRSFRDVDILVDDAEAAQEALLAAGFEPVFDPSKYIDIHHLRPLVAPGLPVGVEVHSRPKWLDGLEGPNVSRLLDHCVESRTGVNGILGPPPGMHAVLLAVHSWAHEPLRRLRDLVDVAVARAAADDREIDRWVDEWHVRRLWTTTCRLLDALFDDDRVPLTLRPWARHLVLARERTVLESHLTSWLSGFGELPPGEASSRLLHTLARESRPAPDEGWRDKLVRTRLALLHARYPRHRHELILDEHNV
jgi:Uncharacterised nucleotidyltransferase